MEDGVGRHRVLLAAPPASVQTLSLGRPEGRWVKVDYQSQYLLSSAVLHTNMEVMIKHAAGHRP